MTQIVNSRLLVTAIGPAYSIAECGEALAWLGAVVFGSVRQLLGFWAPSIAHFAKPPSLVQPEQTHRFHIGLRLAHPRDSASGTPGWPNSWRDLVKDRLVIYGFPVSRRPEGHPGLELSYDTLMYFSQTDTPTITDKLILIQGAKLSLQLVKHDEDVFLWHPFHPLPETCPYCDNHHVEDNTVTRKEAINLLQLQAGRHILRNCEASFPESEPSIVIRR
jgi:hypothetical protein